jgi:isopentenyl-diphosphate delta-isomerase
MYRVEFPDGLTEHEYDHVFVGYANNDPQANPSEVQNWEWVSEAYLAENIEAHPEKYTYWFRLVWKKVFERR